MAAHDQDGSLLQTEGPSKVLVGLNGTELSFLLSAPDMPPGLYERLSRASNLIKYAEIRKRFVR